MNGVVKALIIDDFNNNVNSTEKIEFNPAVTCNFCNVHRLLQDFLTEQIKLHQNCECCHFAQSSGEEKALTTSSIIKRQKVEKTSEQKEQDKVKYKNKVKAMPKIDCEHCGAKYHLYSKQSHLKSQKCTMARSIKSNLITPQ
jgi:hypothetical protein